jgi:hypothetical protein
MKLRIRRISNTLYFEANSGTGTTTVKSIDLPQLPSAVHIAVTSEEPIGSWPVSARSEA